MPNEVRRLKDTKLTTAAAGSNFIIVLDQHGSLYGWRNNNYGQNR